MIQTTSRTRGSVHIVKWTDNPALPWVVVGRSSGTVYGRRQTPQEARHLLREVLSRKRGTPVVSQRQDKSLELRKRGSGYVVVDSDGKVYGHENTYEDGVRLYRRTLEGLSKQGGRHEMKLWHRV